MRQITRRQFDVYCYSRQLLIRVMSQEVAWFEAFNRKILAVVVFDRTDLDYGYVILGRDSRKMFRCLEVSTEFFLSPDDAIDNLAKTILKYESDGQHLYPQGDEKEAPYEIFEPVVPEQRLHQYFRVLIREPRFEAARNLIREIVYSYKDPDGHYIREFQTNGFDARLWELYLYVYLYDEGFEFIRGNAAPDFHVSRFGEECFIEAITVNPSQEPNRPDPPLPTTSEEVLDLTNNYLPIKYGSPLFSKLSKRYWEKEHVYGKPLVLAIHDYHMPGSMTWSRTALSEYLYGVRTRLETDNDGQDRIVVERIEEHYWCDKRISSNFFEQPDAENISAVLFSNAATITKFNRMGKLAGLGSSDVKMIRQGFLFNPDPKALRPTPFAVDVDDPEYEESWSDSIVMYHNPNAKLPINPNWFPSITHIWYDKKENEFRGYHQPYDVLSSITLTITTTGEVSPDADAGMVQSQVTLQTTLASHKVLEFIALWQNGDHGVLP
jgi:hypothetical protein